MMFKESLMGQIIDNRDSIYKDIVMNFNGFEEEFEVRRDMALE